MSLPGNGIFVVQGEMAMLVTAMRRSTRWGSHSFPNEEYDVLMKTFEDLKSILIQVDDLRLLDPTTFLSPFLEVIRSKETTGPVTSLALSAIHKFLSYGLIDPTHPSVPATVEDIADAVTHARFVGTDHASDGVVLMKILQVLRTLMLSPEGSMLTDESVCEIMLSCFRICFETRLTELLRRNAEQCLRDMTQLIFMRLPQFQPEQAGVAFASLGLSLKKRDKAAKKRSAASLNSSSDKNTSTEQNNAQTESEDQDTSKTDALIKHNQDKNLINEAEITIEPVDQPVKSPNKKHGRHSSMDLATNGNTSITQLLEKCVNSTEDSGGPDNVDAAAEDQTAEENTAKEEEVTLTEETTDAEESKQENAETDGGKQSKSPTEGDDKMAEYVNHRGIRFTQQEETVNLVPYGLTCVRELFRFLISLCNPLDGQNTSAMVSLGLSLAGTALEVAAAALSRHPSLMALVKDQLCRNLTSLLSTERISIFALNLQVSFLLFEALRTNLKFQLEAFLKKIVEIISADTTKAVYELKEIHHLALEYLAQLFRIPGLCTELYLNFDCDIYCMNLFEELSKLLSKSVVSSTAYNIHALSLEALMTIIEAIEVANNQVKAEQEETQADDESEPAAFPDRKYGRVGHVTLELGGLEEPGEPLSHISQYVGSRRGAAYTIPTEAELDNIRNTKKWVIQGTELFNQKPERGVEFLQQHGVLATPLDPKQVAAFLRENPDLDKKMIGEYICKRSSSSETEGHSVLAAFAESFDFSGLRIEQALRLYLETFRLPGEAPLIFLVMEKFAEIWHTANGEPFANTDAAFRLAYAVIMLNMDQHNHNAKKLNVPMTVEDFVKNLRGCNGNGDFEQPMLEAVFNSIKSEEMVMPAERVGQVRDAYLWRVLQRRGAAPAALYRQGSTPALAARLYTLVCPLTVSALSAAVERAPSSPAAMARRALEGLERCAALEARLPPHAERPSVDAVALTICKFTGLLTPPATTHIHIGVTLGQSPKAQLALHRVCSVAAKHADSLRDSWRHILEIVKTLYIGRLLPKSLVEVEDYMSPTGTVSLIREASRGNEAGLLSSLYSYIALGESGVRTPSPHEKALIDAATDCVAKCNLPGLLITETKFLHMDSLQELVRAMISVGTPPDSDSLQLNPQLEDITIFFFELLGQTLIQNRDRVMSVWGGAGAHWRRVSRWAGGAVAGGGVAGRLLPALLRTAARLMRSDHCARHVLNTLTLLLDMPYKLFYQHSELISCGLYDVVKTSAQNIHSAEEWNTLFTLLCAAGAGAWPKKNNATASNTASSPSEGSEDESDRRPTSASSESELSHSPHTQGWILVNKQSSVSEPSGLSGPESGVWLRARRSAALARCCEALALVLRDVAHVTPYSCRPAVYAVRVFVRATLQTDKKPKSNSRKSLSSGRRSRDSSDEEDGSHDQDYLVSLQLLDLMHTLHSRTAQIFGWWREEDGALDVDLWDVAWMPLLQGIAIYCTDRRRQVSNSAVAYLQRALLAPSLSSLGGAGWECCFTRVLFPLMAALTTETRAHHAAARADTIMCKVFLHHLSVLSSRPTFGALWLRVISVQRSLVQSPADEQLTEAALESLKNMILVMDSVKVFSNSDGYTDLWYITWEKIGEFLPTLKEELFPQAIDKPKTANIPSHMQPTLPSNLPTLVPVTPTILPVGQTAPMAQPKFVPSPANVSQLSPSSYGQSPTNVHPVSSVTSPPLVAGQSPPIPANPLVTPTPISGMVPIRNQLYNQGGLASSVLLQPLNEMISTPIGTSIAAPMPVLYPAGLAQTPAETAGHPDTTTDHTPDTVPDIQQSELYAEYLSNPYSDTKVSIKEATLYDPEDNRLDQSPNNDSFEVLRHPLLDLDRQKALSANNSPMHRNTALFGSSDNIKKEESSIFNFSSYFGGSEVLAPGSEVFDNLMPTHEG